MTRQKLGPEGHRAITVYCTACGVGYAPGMLSGPFCPKCGGFFSSAAYEITDRRLLGTMYASTRTKPATEATKPQPIPSGKGVDVAELVHRDIEARCEYGVKKYGERLTTHNGRDALADAYQEALDLVMYLRQAISERNEPRQGQLGR